MEQDRASEPSMETRILHLAARWSYSFTREHVELGLHWNPSRAAVWIW